MVDNNVKAERHIKKRNITCRKAVHVPCVRSGINHILSSLLISHDNTFQDRSLESTPSQSLRSLRLVAFV